MQFLVVQGREKMNKHITNVLAKYDFTFNENYGYGHINDYEVNVVNYPSSIGPSFFISTYLTQAQKNDFILRVNALKISMLVPQAFDYGVVVMIGAMTGKRFEVKFDDTMAKIMQILDELEAKKKDICPQSGEILNEDSRTIVVPGSKLKVLLSNNAIATINSNIEKSNEVFENAPNNYLKGLGGIAIGALAGVALTILFWYVGFVTTLAPLVSIILGIFLYKKFGGKANWVMILLSFVVTLVFILGAFTLVYAIGAKNACDEAGYTYSLFEALGFCLDFSEEFRRQFYLDLALNAAFILLAEGFSIYGLIKSIKRPKNIQ